MTYQREIKRLKDIANTVPDPHTRKALSNGLEELYDVSNTVTLNPVGFTIATGGTVSIPTPLYVSFEGRMMEKSSGALLGSAVTKDIAVPSARWVGIAIDFDCLASATAKYITASVSPAATALDVVLLPPRKKNMARVGYVMAKAGASAHATGVSFKLDATGNLTSIRLVETPGGNHTLTLRPGTKGE